MNKKSDKKDVLLSAMSAHVLEHGLNTASLRPLAEAARTSDRMLIYHFGSKDILIKELLEYLAANLAGLLTRALPEKRADTRRRCVEEVLAVMRAPEVQGYIRIWFDILSAARNGHMAHGETGKQVIDLFKDWLLTRVPETEEQPEQLAAALLTLVEGVLVMDSVYREDYAQTAIEVFLGPDD